MRNNSSTPQIKILTKYSHNRSGSLYLNRHQNTFDNLSLALQTVHSILNSGKRPNGQRKEKGQWRVPSSVHKQFPRLFSLYLYVAFPCQLCNLKRTAKLINTETDHWHASTDKRGMYQRVPAKIVKIMKISWKRDREQTSIVDFFFNTKWSSIWDSYSRKLRKYSKNPFSRIL